MAKFPLEADPRCKAARVNGPSERDGHSVLSIDFLGASENGHALLWMSFSAPEAARLLEALRAARTKTMMEGHRLPRPLAIDHIRLTDFGSVKVSASSRGIELSVTRLGKTSDLLLSGADGMRLVQTAVLEMQAHVPATPREASLLRLALA